MISKALFLLLILIASILCAINIGSAEVHAWDEARRGINALRMLQTADWWNYRFLDQTDSFNTKPPLFTWVLALSFKWFGVNIWSLRLPSLLAMLAYLTYLWVWIRDWQNGQLANTVLGILISVNGIIGFHVARAGDTDMLFLLFLTIGLGELFRYLNEAKAIRLYYALGAILLAFLTKGVAIALIIPGAMAYVWRRRAVCQQKFRPVLLVLGTAIAAGFLAYLLCNQFGLATDYANGQKNLWQAMFLTDGVERFSNSEFESGYHWDFLLVALDLGFGPWIYLLYAALILLPITIGWKAFYRWVKKDELLVFSFLLFCSVGFLLTVSQNKHQWYPAPVYPFLAYALARAIHFLFEWKRFLVYPILLIWLVLIGFKARHHYHDQDAIRPLTKIWEDELLNNASVAVPNNVPQQLLFHLYLRNPRLQIVTGEASADLWLQKGDCPDKILGYCLE
ncbi:ArnT family glycosyltransferase [Neolewinella agarilytica]|uniref:ArnT family glycosyltransferase n=1 Tax=Neolewinella agarilytica TaxID=478744 RepID=UPI0023575A6A|nr:glycosyltransferase family 39 protein [Neolewinella agarilytica]